jgi:hypothetical protein
MVDDQWKRLLLIERICELDALARECGDPEIAKTVLRARLCLEDSELGMAERFCIYAELAITGQKRVCSEIVS